MAFGVNVTDTPLSSITGLKIQSYSKTPRAESTADALDEMGDVAARTYYGGDTSLLTCSASFKLVSGAIAANTTVEMGKGTGTKYLTSLSISTSNGDWPQIDVSWLEGFTNVEGNTYTITLPQIDGKRIAQALGITVGTGAKLQSAGVSYTVDFSEVTDEAGEYAGGFLAHCVAECTADAVAVTSTPTYTADSGWTLEETGGLSETSTAYGTSSAKASKFIAADSTSNS